MSTELHMVEKRRGERVLIRVPVQLKAVAADGSDVTQAAETAVVSRFGALLRASSLLKMGSHLTVTNGFTHESEEFRIVWISERQNDGRWDTGIEALRPRDDFWGIRFPPKERKA